MFVLTVDGLYCRSYRTIVELFNTLPVGEIGVNIRRAIEYTNHYHGQLNDRHVTIDRL